jgi:fimbrial chaperone protein
MVNMIAVRSWISRTGLRLGALLCAVSSGVPANAAAVVLWPVNPTIAADQQASALWLENRGDTPVTLQADGADQYADQDQVVASPPIATVQPGKRQLVRLIRRTPANQNSEHAYRLLIDQLPQPFDEKGERAQSAQLSIQMRYSVPLFTYGAQPTVPASQLSARVTLVDGKRFVEIHNAGSMHARLTNLRLVREARQFGVNNGLVGYVLPGATMRWPLPSDAPLSGAFLVNVNGTDQQLSPNT